MLPLPRLSSPSCDHKMALFARGRSQNFSPAMLCQIGPRKTCHPLTTALKWPPIRAKLAWEVSRLIRGQEILLAHMDSVHCYIYVSIREKP